MIHQLLNLTRPLFVVDTETTGTDVQKDRIVSIGFEMWEASGLTKEWKSLINPGIQIPESATKVHGITDERVRGCRKCGKQLEDHQEKLSYDTDIGLCVFEPWPTFKALASNLASGFSNCDFAGKRVRFDLRITSTEMGRNGVEWSYADARVIDAERLEQLAIPRSLSHLYEKYTGEKLEGAHDALTDVKASTVVIVKQLEMHSTLPRDMDALHAQQWPGWIDGDGKFKFVEGVACFGQWGKYAGMPMTKADKGYWDFILSNDFSADVKAVARKAKLGQFPEVK